MTKMEDLMRTALGKRTSELATELEGKKMNAVTDLKELSALAKAVLAIKSQVAEQKRILSDYYKIKKGDLGKEVVGFYLPPSHAKMIWQGNKTAILYDKENRALIGKELFYAEENNCYGKIKITGITPIDSEKFAELSSQHRFSPEEKETLFGKNNNLFLYSFEQIEKFEAPVPVASGELGFVSEIKFLSGRSENEGIEFEDEAAIKDFMLLVSGSGLVNSLPEPDVFVRTIFELVKLENSLISQRQGIRLFEQAVVPKPSKVFYEKSDVLNDFFGGS